MSALPQTPQTHDGGDSPAVAAAPVLFSVTRGNPTAEEIAALTAVLASLGTAEPEAAPAAPTRRERIRRATLRPRHMIAQRRGRA
ncbi:acyl-CoA carboxylase subunit epsilon [Sinomonas atrocyanea]